MNKLIISMILVMLCFVLCTYHIYENQRNTIDSIEVNKGVSGTKYRYKLYLKVGEDAIIYYTNNTNFRPSDIVKCTFVRDDILESVQNYESKRSR